jgi:hypothetical protein
MVSCCSKADKGTKEGRVIPGGGSPRPIQRLVKNPSLMPLRQPLGGHRRGSETPHRAMAQSVHFATVHKVENDSLIVFSELSGYITGTIPAGLDKDKWQASLNEGPPVRIAVALPRVGSYALKFRHQERMLSWFGRLSKRFAASPRRPRLFDRRYRTRWSIRPR